MQYQNKKLDNFFNPESIAIVGATDGIGKTGTVITNNILKLGYRGKIFLVNPNRKTLYGHICYTKLEEIKEKIDLAVVVVPADLACEIVIQAADKVKNFIIISAGFSEAGSEGKSREMRLKRIAREKNLNILGPNCLGMIFPRLKLNTSFSAGLPEKGNVAFISQSGALAVALMDIFRNEQVGFSGVISIGNKMDIDESDLIDYFGQDKETKVIGLYLEGIKYGRKFVEKCTAISSQKPIIILKAGKSQQAQQAIESHTGALAGERKTISAIFEKCKIIEADNFEQFVDLVKLASFTEPLKNEKVAIITNAGGAGVIAADEFENKNIQLCKFKNSLKEKIKKHLPQAASVENPIDVLGDAHEDRYQYVLSVIAKEKEELGAVGIILTPQEQTPIEKITQVVINFKKENFIVPICSFIGGERVKKGKFILAQEKVANFETPERMISALEKYCLWSLERKKKTTETFVFNHFRQKEATKIIQEAQKKGRKLLLYKEAEKLFSLYGIPVMESWNSVHQLSVKFPAVIKVDNGKLAHKTEKKAIFTNIKNRNELIRTAETIKNHFPGSSFIIQPQSENHLEIIIGIKKDENFGPILTFGLGGIYTENFNLVDLLIPPNGIREIEKKIKSGYLGSILAGARGFSYNIAELARIIKAIGCFSLECYQIQGLDINPLFIYNDNRRAVCADIKIFV